MAKTYEIRTIKDIFDNVPPERWDTLFAELLAMLNQADAERSIMRALSELIGVSPDTVIFDEKIVWADDDKATVTTIFAADDIEMASITTKL